MTDVREGRISHSEREVSAEPDRLTKLGAELCGCPSNAVLMSKGMLHVARLFLLFFRWTEGQHVREGRWDYVGELLAMAEDARQALAFIGGL
eukprot:4273980-Pyramimonas_sp.AAC.1